MKQRIITERKMKIIGIVVSMLIFLTISISSMATANKQIYRTTSHIADVPVWEIGDKWTYIFTEIRTIDPAYAITGDLTLEVVDESEESYILEASTRPKGGFDLGDFGLKTTMFTFFSLQLQMRKADLGLERFVEKLKGILLLTIGSRTLPIPLQISANYNIEFDPTWVIIPFPLYDGKTGNLSSTEILHINDTILMFWGLITVFGPHTEALPLAPIPYTCSLEELTVEAGTFDVYNVSAGFIKDWQFESYYAPEIGNVAKEIIYIPSGGSGEVVNHYILELKSWSYTSNTG